MARYVWCLCLILTLSTAGSTRPAVARTVDSHPRWVTKEAQEIKAAAERFRAEHKYREAEAVDLHAYARARELHNDAAAFTYLTAAGAAQLIQFKYRPALESFLGAKELAARVGDPVAQGIIAINLS